MAKWADFVISAVDYSTAPKHIDRVRMHLDHGDTIGNGAEMRRSAVLSWIASGYSVATIVLNDGKWNKGADVQVVHVNNKGYLRTSPDKNEQDNLGSLPRL